MPNSYQLVAAKLELHLGFGITRRRVVGQARAGVGHTEKKGGQHGGQKMKEDNDKDRKRKCRNKEMDM
jgi:hypothetical protein